MTDTDQLPPHTITIHDHPEPRIMQWSDLELAAVKRYAEQYALQARAILALRPQAAPMTEEQAEELAYQAFKDHMEDRNDDMEIDLVRKVERFHRIGITAQDKKEAS